MQCLLRRVRCDVLIRRGLNTMSLERLRRPLALPERLLLGPGPTNMAPSVHQVLQTTGTLGHLHPEFVEVMDDVKAGLQYVLKTSNASTFAISGTGHAGMEAAFVNMIEPGTRVLVCQQGIWGMRASHLAKVMGAEVETIVTPLGTVFAVETIAAAVRRSRPELLFVCYGESSTGVLQPLEGVGDVCREVDCLLVVDTVAALCAAPFDMDALKVDIVYSATQKALSAPTGLAPISFNERAWRRYHARKVPVPSFYFDLHALANYWGCIDEPRKYHHTLPIQLVYGLRQALSLVVEEGIDDCVRRHADNAAALHAALADIQLVCFVSDASARNPAVTTVRIPASVGDRWQAVMAHVKNEHGIEIAGGLGETVGVIWRIGLMGYNSRRANVVKVVDALQDAIQRQAKL